MRPASRLVQLVALLAVALSVGWLLLRRRTSPRQASVPIRPAPTPVTPAEPRAPEPVSAIGRPVHDAGGGDQELQGRGPEDRAPEHRAPEDRELADDLRRIRGVGPAIESTLHSLGVRSYRQLATLDEAGRDRLRDAVHDRWHRLEREDWIGQARQLHREKYGEEV